MGVPGDLEVTMATVRRQKLKVFQAQFGFYDTVVAASSQAAALRAWGTQQNLFASGAAKVTTDDAAVAAALKHPETLLRRAVGSSDPFELESTKLPDIPDEQMGPAAASKPKTRSVAKPKAAKPKPPPPDRSDLDAAEAALARIARDRKAEEAEQRRRQEALDLAVSEAQVAYVDARKTATAAVVKARKAYRAAGGRD